MNWKSFILLVFKSVPTGLKSAIKERSKSLEKVRRGFAVALLRAVPIFYDKVAGFPLQKVNVKVAGWRPGC